MPTDRLDVLRTGKESPYGHSMKVMSPVDTCDDSWPSKQSRLAAPLFWPEGHNNDSQTSEQVTVVTLPRLRNGVYKSRLANLIGFSYCNRPIASNHPSKLRQQPEPELASTARGLEAGEWRRHCLRYRSH